MARTKEADNAEQASEGRRCNPSLKAGGNDRGLTPQMGAGEKRVQRGGAGRKPQI